VIEDQKIVVGQTTTTNTCKKIMSKETSKHIFLYLTMTTQMTCERKKEG
jgi:hypothetical protein